MTNLMIDDATLAKLEAMAKEATPGPWYFKYNPSDCTYTIRDHIATWVGDTLPESTATLIVESRNALPDLLATIRALKQDRNIFSAQFFAATKRYELLEKQIKKLKAALERITTLHLHDFPVDPTELLSEVPRTDWGLGVRMGRDEAREIAQAALRGEEAPCPSK